MKKLSLLVSLVLLLALVPFGTRAEESASPIVFDTDLFQVLFFLEKDLPYEDALSVIEQSAYQPIDRETAYAVRAEVDFSAFIEVLEGTLIKTEMILSYSEHMALQLRFVHPEESVPGGENDGMIFPEVMEDGMDGRVSLVFWMNEDEADEFKDEQKALRLDTVTILFNHRAGTEDWSGSWGLPVDLSLMRQMREEWERGLALTGEDIPLIEYLQQIPK